MSLESTTVAVYRPVEEVGNGKYSPVRKVTVTNPVSNMIWEGGPVNPDLGIEVDERHPDTHPLSAKVTLKRNGSVNGSVATPELNSLRPVSLDALDLRLMSTMEGRE